MRKSARNDLVLPFDATLHYLPDEETFSIEGPAGLSLVETDRWEILSIHGGHLDKLAFLSILQRRSIQILRSQQPSARQRAKILPVAVPIRILGLSMENSVTSFQLLGHALPE